MARFVNLNNILSDGKVGSAEIKHFTVAKNDIRAMINGIPCGDYVGLSINGEIMMSNTPMELRTNQKFINSAHGDVLIGGLGIGLILLPLVSNELKQKTNEIIVIEKNKDVIELVLPQLEKYLDDRVTVINDDVFEYVPSKNFNTIYMDIWSYINSDIYEEEMIPLLEFYDNYIDHSDEKAFLKCWCQHQAKHNLRI
jgi:hypothetical protein